MSRCTFPSTRRSRCSGTEEYEAAKRNDPVPRFRGQLMTRGVLTPEEADRIAAEVRDEMQAAVDFALGSPYPAAEAAVNHVYA